MNYRNDQFFPSDIFSDGRDDPTEKSNPPFVYPDRVVRVLAHKDGRRDEPLTLKAVTLDRGFMRNLYTDLGAGETLPKRRLNFQFNPQDIQQVVSQREGMYLSILQDPAQFLQPTAGSTSFAFDLLFDRTMEVANNTGQTADLQNPGPEDAYDIGVLADLNQLYTIIGQGFSKDLLDYQTAKLKADAQQQYQSNLDEFTTDEGTVIDTSKGFATIDQFASSINLGNSAFLIPQPVRIVFSSLFMVDGFITSTDIQFTKFNTNMVPIQCKVILQVNAIYIGFARDKTFLTTQLERASDLRTAEIESAKDEIKSNLSLYQQYLKNIRIGFALDGKIIGMSTPSNRYTSYSQMEFSGFATRGWSARQVSNYGSQTTPGIVASFYTTEVSQVMLKDNPILDLYENGNTTKIQQTIFVDVYGPYDNEQTATQEKNSGGTYTKKKVGQYSIRRTATDANSWTESIAYQMANDDLNTANVSPFAITPENAGTYGITGLTNWNGEGERPTLEYIKAALQDKYFIVYVSVRIQITETVGEASSTVERYVNETTVYKGSDTGRNKIFSFQWVSSFVPDRVDN